MRIPQLMVVVAGVAASSFTPAARLSAQDPPPVPLSGEPRHHVVYESPALRVHDIQIPPGDTTLFHTHDTAILYVPIARSTNRSQVLGAEWTGGGRRGRAAPADAGARAARPGQQRHDLRREAVHASGEQRRDDALPPDWHRQSHRRCPRRRRRRRVGAVGQAGAREPLVSCPPCRAGARYGDGVAPPRLAGGDRDADTWHRGRGGQDVEPAQRHRRFRVAAGRQLTSSTTAAARRSSWSRSRSAAPSSRTRPVGEAALKSRPTRVDSRPAVRARRSRPRWTPDRSPPRREPARG